MERLICLAAGYVCGLLQTGYLVGRMNHIDIRQKGSGNAGSTNAVRVLGWKAGLMTFAGDVLKCVAAVVIAVLLFRGSDCMPLLAMYAGAGVTLGHNFPFYMNFKGGKGIAVMAGLVAATSFWNLPSSLMFIPVTLLFFLVPVLLTRYISLGSLLAYSAFFVEVVIAGRSGWFDMEIHYLYEMDIVVLALTVLAFYRHRENIKRLLSGTENKFGTKKKE